MRVITVCIVNPRAEGIDMCEHSALGTRPAIAFGARSAKIAKENGPPHQVTRWAKLDLQFTAVYAGDQASGGGQRT